MAKDIPDNRLNVTGEVIQVIRCGLQCQEDYYRMITGPSRSEANKVTCDFLAEWCDEQEEWLAQDDMPEAVTITNAAETITSVVYACTDEGWVPVKDLRVKGG